MIKHSWRKVSAPMLAIALVLPVTSGVAVQAAPSNAATAAHTGKADDSAIGADEAKEELAATLEQFFSTVVVQDESGQWTVDEKAAINAGVAKENLPNLQKPQMTSMEFKILQKIV